MWSSVLPKTPHSVSASLASLSTLQSAITRRFTVRGPRQLTCTRRLGSKTILSSVESCSRQSGFSSVSVITLHPRKFSSVCWSLFTMGGKPSKSRKGSTSVQGLNFSQKQEAQPAYSGVVQGASGGAASPLSTSASDMTSSMEVVACKVDDLHDGQTREVEVGDSKVLLVKDKGNFFAVGNKCTHYGLPLSKGVYCNGVVRCSFHGACFNVKTGDIEDFPGLDSLPVFQVEIRGSDVVIKTDAEAVKVTKRVKAMSRADPSNTKTFVLIGGGPASVACAETLRQEGFTGRILVLTKENVLPYDRPKLSKAMNSRHDAITLRNQEFYSNADIQFNLGTEVTGVDTAQKEVTTATGEKIKYDSLLVATGGTPRTVPFPGVELQNVCILRTLEDANRIAANSKGKKVVIIGSSFIGMEVASCVAESASSVSVVDMIRVPFELVLGPDVGLALQKMHEEKGVKFYFERGLKEFVGEGGVLKQAVLSDGTILDADVCVLGIGVVPATGFLKDSGITLTQRGFVTVDKHMKTSADGVYGAGDIVEFPLFINDDQPSNVQHWQMAHNHGRIAALNMLGKDVAVRSVPYFWTVMYGKSVRYTGYGPGYDDIIIHGNLEDPHQFVAFYTKGDKVVAAASLNFDPIVTQLAAFLQKGDTILKSDVAEDPKSFTARLNR